MPSRKRRSDSPVASRDPVTAALRTFFGACTEVGRVRVAFSGGLDSGVLLHAAARLGLPGVEAMHVDHRLRADSSEQAEFCRRTGERLAVPVEIRALPPLNSAPAGVEAAARAARYAALRESLGQDDLIVTAQHADDQAETFLLAALRGSGPDGLQGMRTLRPEGDTWLGRPLLGLPREMLAAYARRERLSWYEDPSNRDSRYDRNYLREQVMPLLRDRFDVPAALCRAAGWQQETAEILGDCYGSRLAHIRGPDGSSLQRTRLCALEPADQRGVVRYWLRERGIRPPGHERLGEFLRQVEEAGPDAAPLMCWSQGWVRCYRDRLFAGEHDAGTNKGGEGTGPYWPPGQPELVLDDGRRVTRDELARRGVARDLPLQVGYRTRGEVVRTSAGRRPLKKLMQEHGVPPWERGRIPLLLNTDGEVVLVLWGEWAHGGS